MDVVDGSTPLHFDAWASGQVGSKILAVRAAGAAWPNGLAVGAVDFGRLVWNECFLLLSRQRARIQHIRSFDIDPNCEKLANRFLENWVWREWQFKAYTADVNQLDYRRPEAWASQSPHVVINTSTEHIASRDWWERIPGGTFVVLQSNNMRHEDHVICVESEAHMQSLFPLTEQRYSGRLDFYYANQPRNFFYALDVDGV